jgi:hypothetical protein
VHGHDSRLTAVLRSFSNYSLDGIKQCRSGTLALSLTRQAGFHWRSRLTASAALRRCDETEGFIPFGQFIISNVPLLHPEAQSTATLKRGYAGNFFAAFQSGCFTAPIIKALLLFVYFCAIAPAQSRTCNLPVQRSVSAAA